jgi:hypothetical protein
MDFKCEHPKRSSSRDLASMSLAISVGQHDRIQGFATASVTLVEYGDYDASAAEQLINNHAVRSPQTRTRRSHHRASR